MKNTATFTFTGVSGFIEANIVDSVVFGLGTPPDSSFTVSVPEPGAFAFWPRPLSRWRLAGVYAGVTGSDFLPAETVPPAPFRLSVQDDSLPSPDSVTASFFTF